MAEISQIDKLKSLVAQGVKANSKMSFNNLVICYLGVKPKLHYPKLKNADGGNKLDASGQVVKSDKPDGYVYTFSEFATCNKVMVILNKKLEFGLMKAYSLSGLGYQMRSSNLIYIDEQVNVANY